MELLTKAQAELLADRKTKQLLFDLVVVRMKAQGKPGTVGNKAMLRCKDGSKCSLGHLISDSKYRKVMEKRTPNETMIEMLDMPRLGYQFYDDIQEAHDKSANAKNWWASFTNYMALVARKHFLDPSSLTPITARV